MNARLSGRLTDERVMRKIPFVKLDVYPNRNEKTVFRKIDHGVPKASRLQELALDRCGDSVKLASIYSQAARNARALTLTW